MTDSGSNTIRKISTTGDVTTLPLSFSDLRDIKIDADNNLYVLDNYAVIKVTPDLNSDVQYQFPTSAGNASPKDIAVDGEKRIYARTEHNNGKWIYQINPDKTRDLIYQNSSFNTYYGMGSDVQGNLALYSYGPLPGAYRLTFIPKAAQPVPANSSTGISSETLPVQNGANSTLAYDESGNLYISEITGAQNGSVRILRRAADGTYTTLLSGLPSGADTSGMNAVRRAGISSAHNGDILFADPYEHVIYRVKPSGETVLIAGKLGESGSSD